MNKGIMNLLDIAKGLREAMRLGTEKDEPEGNRYIVLSDTLANHIADTLEEHLASLNSWTWGPRGKGGSFQKKMDEIQAERHRQDIK